MQLKRRTFLLGATAVATLGRTAIAQSKKQSAKDIRVGVVGVRNRGREHINGLLDNVTAICDVDAEILGKVVDATAERTGRKIQSFSDYRKLIDSDDIDAIAIATPNHTHCLIAISACQAGKDVYCEKPISHNVWEGRQLVNAARRYNRIVQCGTQSRSSPALVEAAEFVRGGVLGKLKLVTGTCYKPRPSIGKLDKPLEIPKHIDYDLWCGPAAKVDLYRPQLHYDWHWDFNTGNGDMGNQGIHQMDIARWFLGEQTLAPRTLSVGGRVGYEDAGNTPNTQIVIHEYASAPLIFETRGLPKSKAAQQKWAESMDAYRGSQVGVVVQCEDGHVVIPSYSQATAYDADGDEINTWREGGDHFQNWLTAVEARDASLLSAEILEGHLSSALCHVGGISHQMGEPATRKEIEKAAAMNDDFADAFDRMAAHLKKNEIDVDETPLSLGRRLEVDVKTESIASDRDASRLLTREYRRGYEVPEISAELVGSTG